MFLSGLTTKNYKPGLIVQRRKRMKRKVIFMVTIICLAFTANSVYAAHHWSSASESKGKVCHLKSGGSGCQGKSCQGKCEYKKTKKSLEKKLMQMFKAIYNYEHELGLTEEQLAQIKAVKVDIKKELIRHKADIDIIKVDFDALLYEDELDLETINQLIEQKYEVKTSKTKKIVATYAELKKILTKDQMESLKALKSGKKPSSLPVPMQKLIPPAEK
jgi:Spy/CpxP family protein refolding chaperone